MTERKRHSIDEYLIEKGVDPIETVFMTIDDLRKIPSSLFNVYYDVKNPLKMFVESRNKQLKIQLKYDNKDENGLFIVSYSSPEKQIFGGIYQNLNLFRMMAESYLSGKPDPKQSERPHRKAYFLENKEKQCTDEMHLGFNNEEKVPYCSYSSRRSEVMKVFWKMVDYYKKYNKFIKKD